MTDTSGFYKLDDATRALMYAPNYVASPSFTLHRDDQSSKVGVYDGWQWFDSDADAYLSYGMATVKVWEISKAKAKLALLEAGLLDTIEEMIAASDKATQIAWLESTAFERDSPLLNSMASALGLTSEQVDALFITAGNIKI